MTNQGFIQVDQGKQVRFKQGGELIKGTEDAIFLLEEDINLIMSSHFSSVFEAQTPAFISMLSKQAGAAFGDRIGSLFSGQWKQFGFQTWTSTEPLSTTLTIVASMNHNAYKDVVLPIMTLAKLCLPTDTGGGSLLGPGPVLLESMTESQIEKTKANGTYERIIAGRQLNCYLGNYYLPNIIIKTAQPSFSRQIDNYGYPIQGRIQLDLSTVFSANTGMIDEIIRRV